ncbi:MAG: hypothetical protein ACYTBV_18785, partial [Planctomycetota bacterium]
TEDQSNTNKQPFAKKAAKLSLSIPLVTFAIGWLMQSFVPNPMSRELDIAIGIISLILVLIALILGIFALVSMRKYRRRGILGYACGGIIVNSLIIVGFVFSFITLIVTISRERREIQIQQDKEKYGLISAERYPGTSCDPNDSASIKRRPFHPIRSTVGWRLKAEIDISRHHDSAKNKFGQIGNDIAGYAQFPVSGRLIMRCYDDVYGSVYGGWSPTFVEYEPQPKPVYVIFPRFRVGDGRLDQVHELCWFPKGEERGVILYSSAHPEKNELKPHELFLPRHIGVLTKHGNNEYFHFYDHEADKIFDSLLVARELTQVRELVSINIDRLQYLYPTVEGSTGKPIPSDEFYCDIWVKLLLLKSGTNPFDPSSHDSLLKAKTILAKGGRFCLKNSYTTNLIDLYVWALDRIQGKDVAIPQIPETTKRVHGYDPRLITKILLDPNITDTTLTKSDLTLGGESNYFWLGLREYLSGNTDEASRYLSLYVKRPNRACNDFELAVAVSLQTKTDYH